VGVHSLYRAGNWRSEGVICNRALKQAARTLSPFGAWVCFESERLRKFEFHRDLGLNLDGLVVEVVGFVFPLLDGSDRGVGEDGIAAE
jgi:hypothetical protein